MLLIVVLPVLFVLTVVPILTLLYGITRWQTETGRIRHRIETNRSRITERVFDPAEIRDLPPAVQEYFQAVLTPGAPLVAIAEIGHKGEFNLDPARERWTRFRSTQLVSTQRPGFDWDARIRKAPGVQVFVHDAYVAGEGFLKASLFGLFRVAEERGAPELAQAELMRFLAEAPWYPTRLLPSQGVRWEAIDGHSALATLSDGDTQVSLTFSFDEGGLIRQVDSAGRWRAEPGGFVVTPWEARFWGYETRGGMRVPIHGEAAWMPASGRRPYWRGTVTDILYKFAR